MDFASDYILDNQEDEYECVSEDELLGGMQLSESDSDSDEHPECVPDNDRVSQSTSRPRSLINAVQNLIPSRKKKKVSRITRKPHHWQQAERSVTSIGKPDRGVSAEKWFRKADTNVVSVNFSTLLSPGQMHAGDPVVCSSCQAILSHISKTEGDMEDKMWTCEFCHNEMHVDIEEEEIAKSEDVTYLMEPGIATKSATLSGQDQALVIFCVDTSGSMCVTSEVEGKVKLRGTSQLKRLESFNPDQEDQYLPSQKRRNVSYISRLQAMQAAVNDQLGTMAKDFPDRRVGLVTFSNDVTIIGDGRQEEVTVAGDKLTNIEQLANEGSELTLPQAIKTSCKMLGEKVYRLEEGGATALGPALVVAVSMASHHPGSKVIVCTDGKANIGLGKVENDADEQVANDFYTGVGEKAVAKGVSISVTTIKGTDCKLVHLGQLASKTGGQVNIVDPLNLTKEFGNILADPIIATNVKAKFLVHKALYVIDESDPDSQECYGESAPGNVTSNSSITFDFGRRQSQSKDSSPSTKAGGKKTKVPSSDREEGAASGATAPIPIAGAIPPKDYPFQLQIHYTDTEGIKALRVITKTMPATNDRNLAEKHSNMDILGMHAAKKSADLALLGQYTKSRGVALMNQRFAWRHSHSDASSKSDRKKYKNLYSKVKHMENLLQRKQQSEIAESGRTRSDSEGDDEYADEYCLYDNSASVYSNQKSIKAAHKSKKLRHLRSSEMEDDLYNVAYNLNQMQPDRVAVMAAPQMEEDDSSGLSSKGEGKESGGLEIKLPPPLPRRKDPL